MRQLRASLLALERFLNVVDGGESIPASGDVHCSRSPSVDSDGDSSSAEVNDVSSRGYSRSPSASSPRPFTQDPPSQADSIPVPLHNATSVPLSALLNPVSPLSESRMISFSRRHILFANLD
jgi:hypothetical protein